MVLCGSEKLMDIRLASAKTVKQNTVFRQVDLCTNQFVRAGTFHVPTMAHNIEKLIVSCATDENHLALRSLRVIQLPIFWNQPTRWRCFKPFSIFFIDRLDIKLRLLLYCTQIIKLKSLPNTPFPSTIVTFDRCLKACFPWRREHRNHIQTQATSNDFPQAVRPSTSLKNGRVVELGIVRQAILSPMFDQLSHCIFRCHAAHRPRTNQFAMQRNSVQNLKSCSALKAQIFDEIKLIQLGDSFGERLQIPTWWWRQISFSMSSIQFTVPFQNPVDGCSRWRCRTFSSFHFAKDRIGSILAKSTVFLEVLTNFKDARFNFIGTPINWRGCSIRPVRPVDTVKSFVLGSLNPMFNTRFTDMKLFRNITQRLAASNGLDHTSPVFHLRTLPFDSYSISSKKTNFKITLF